MIDPGFYPTQAPGLQPQEFKSFVLDAALAMAHGGRINIVQGEDMGSRSLMQADIAAQEGGSIRVSGAARIIGS